MYNNIVNSSTIENERANGNNNDISDTIAANAIPASAITAATRPNIATSEPVTHLISIPIPIRGIGM